jgi:hypothetical protein
MGPAGAGPEAMSSGVAFDAGALTRSSPANDLRVIDPNLTLLTP